MTSTETYIGMHTLREIRKFLANPQNKAMLDRKIEERKKRLATAERRSHEEVLS
mgnify:FL=1